MMTKLIRRVLWACSGATLSVLEKEECETEHSKYVGIGAAVLLTGILAGVTATYAFSTIQHPAIQNSRVWPVLFGIFWALIIFNLDRYIVLSIRKRAPGTYVSWGQRVETWATALLRLALAALLAVVIAKPLELLIFKSEVELELDSVRAELVQEFTKEFAAEPGQEAATGVAAQVAELRKANETLEGEITAKEAEKAKIRKAAVDEAEGRGGRPAGEGTVYQLKRTIAENAAKELDEYIKPRREQITRNNKKIETLQGQETDIRARAEEKARRTEGLGIQLRAFSKLTGRNSAMWYANLVIMAIILILEIAPIMTKLFAAYGPYDMLVDFRQQKVKLETDLAREELQAEIEQSRGSGLKRRNLLRQVENRFSSDVVNETANLKPGTMLERSWTASKNSVITEGMLGISRQSENGDEH